MKEQSDQRNIMANDLIGLILQACKFDMLQNLEPLVAYKIST